MYKQCLHKDLSLFISIRGILLFWEVFKKNEGGIYIDQTSY